ncbi:MAG TPA: HEAT repeat domain-containing protein [Puia sp.]|nr:HEAT repeat domain-containing protein [Puia sp.]
MSCQHHKELLERWWNDRLTDVERASLEAQLSACEDCRREMEGSRELWALMGLMPVPEPSREMQLRFNAMLGNYKEEEGKWRRTTAGVAGLWQMFRYRPWVAGAFGVLLLLVGIALGMLVDRPRRTSGTGATANVGAATVAGPAAVAKTTSVTAPMKTTVGLSSPTARNVGSTAVRDQRPGEESRQLQALTAQVHEMREMMMLSLLQNPAASERIRAVSYTSDIRHVDPKIATALLATLNNDPNVNVRLTTLEALTHFARDPRIREGLVQSILQQQSPLVQAALADVMLRLQEKRAVAPFKKLLQQKELNTMVRARIEQTIDGLT